MTPSDAAHDVAVFGGGMCGLGAALELADQGKKVLVVERRATLGWEATAAFHGELGATETNLGARLAAELEGIRGVHEGWVDPARTELVLDRLLSEAGIDVLLFSQPVGLVADDGLVRGVVIGNKNGLSVISAKSFVDATEEALLFRESGAAIAHQQPVPAKQVAFLNCATDGLTLPLSLGDTDTARNITLHATMRDHEACTEYEVADCSVTGARLAVAQVLFLIRANVRELSQSIVTRCGPEPLPLGPLARLDGPAPANLFACGTWATDGEERNTLSGRIAIGEQLAATVGDAVADMPEPMQVDAPALEPRRKEAEVVVCGGGAAGPLAAIAAGRMGAKTVLLEACTLLGGMGTGGVVHAYYPMQPVGLGGLGFLDQRIYAPEKVFEFSYRAFGGLQDELDARVAKVSTFLFEGGQHKAYGFHPEAKKFVLEQMCHEAGVEVIYGATTLDVEMDGERVRAVSAATPEGLVSYQGEVFIDSTGDADVAARAGAQFTLGREGDGVQHTVTQLSGFLGGHGNLSLGGCPTDLIYADLTDAADLTRARKAGLAWMRERVVETDGWPSFLYIGPQLGLRQSRQIVGDYQLTLADQIAARAFDDCIGYMQAHFDDHAYDYENESDEAMLWAWLLGGWGEMIGCELPYRSLLPRGIEGLLVACRGLSMTVDAHYSFRMQPELQQIAEAAGIAAALAVKGGVTPRALGPAPVREELTNRNVLGEHRRPPALIPDQTLNETEEMLLSDEPEDAVWLLTQRPAEDAVPIARRALKGNNSHARFWASVVLAMHNSPDALPELVACVQERRAEKADRLKAVPRWQASIALLGRIADAQATPALLDVLNDETAEFDVLLATARALGRIGDPSAVPALEALLRRDDLADLPKLKRPAREDVLWQLELMAAEALARCGAVGPARTVAAGYADDPRGHVRRRAETVAAQCGPAL